MSYFVKERDRAPAVTTPIPTDVSLPRTCVIGAGASGLAAVKALHQAAVPVDCFEQGSIVGGNWVFANPNGQSACYETLEINTSCPRMAFSDFPMPSDYPAYARHDQVADYFEAYVDHFGFRARIRFNTRVDEVIPENGGWKVAITGPDGTEEHHYDAVLVANGHHWDARWPEPAYPGNFAGEQLHAHDYRSAEQLKERNVVVVGAGNSALDIASEAGRVAHSAVLSQRRGQWVLRKYFLGRASDQLVLPQWLPWWATRARLRLASILSGSTTRLGLPHPTHAPGQSHPVQSEQIRRMLKVGAVTPKPGIERLHGDQVVFTDGSATAADLIIWATGYRVRFPFLSEDLVNPAGNELPLWKRTVHPDHPGLFFIGLLQPIGAVMPLAEAQSLWVTEMLTGSYLAPPEATIRTQMERDQQRNARRFYASARHTMEVDFDSYLWDLDRERRRGSARASQSAARSRIHQAVTA
ncbi:MULTISPECIES: flavin-containing monooxygenase [Arthrobacter]|uniref:flavin-containing monooxygenase n=1 Tax=Arthrobacter TaxID=1663 RepID=UPI003FCF0B58